MSDLDGSTSRKDSVRAAIEAQEARTAAPYDGVLGLLPEWVPEWHQLEFRTTRNRLLDRRSDGDPPTVAQIVTWMDEYAAIQQLADSEAIYHSIPVDIWSEISVLAGYRFVVQQGEDKGLLMLGGKSAIVGRARRKKQSEIAQRPRPHRGIAWLVREVALKTDALGDLLPAEEAWDEFVTKLSERRMLVSEGRRHGRKPTTVTFEPIAGEDSLHERTITYANFQSSLSKERQKLLR